jgi:hypothetical protein
MWLAFYQALSNFWNPTPELRAAMALPFQERIKQLWRWSSWRASFRWPVLWRRLVVMFVAMQLWNVGYLAVRGFEKEAVGVVRAETPEFPYRTAEISISCLRLLLTLWACGQRACVVHHVHGVAARLH